MVSLDNLLRELNGLKADGSQWAAAMHEFLLDLHKKPRPIAVVAEVQKPYQTILEQAEQEEPPPPAQPAWETQANAGA